MLLNGCFTVFCFEVFSFSIPIKRFKSINKRPTFRFFRYALTPIRFALRVPPTTTATRVLICGQKNTTTLVRADRIAQFFAQHSPSPLARLPVRMSHRARATLLALKRTAHTEPYGGRTRAVQKRHRSSRRRRTTNVYSSSSIQNETPFRSVLGRQQPCRELPVR